MLKSLPRVVVTGYGCLTPVGQSAKDTFAAILAKKSNFRRLKDISDLRNPENYPLDQYVSAVDIDRQELVKAWDKLNPTRSNAFLNIALTEAIRHANLDQEAISKDPERVGVSIGALSSNVTFLNESILASQATKYAGIHRFTMMNVLNNILATSVSIRLGTKGPMLTPATACATGLSAIGEAMNSIRLGYADIFVCGAAEEVLNPVSIWGPIRLGTINREPKNGKICAPFDRDRNGIILGEAGAVVIIESLDSALKRQVPIIAEILDFGMSSDGFHFVKPEPTGEGGFRAMKMACRSFLSSDALVSGELTIGKVVANAHATGTLVGDIAELQAIGRFAEACPKASEKDDKVLVTALKGNFGHCFSAAGALETIMGIEGLVQGKLPPINNFEATDEGICPANLTLASEAIDCPERTFLLKSSFGFGGVNNAILIKKFTK
jgi:3-oxoacyl-[acyl-carrier-protein] synthase II